MTNDDDDDEDDADAAADAVAKYDRDSFREGDSSNSCLPTWGSYFQS